MSTSTSDDERCFDGKEWHLKEFTDCKFDRSWLQNPEDFDEIGRFILDNFSSQVGVKWPSPSSGGMCVFRNRGFVGHIKLPNDYSIRLVPKVGVKNVFEMMEYAYDLGEFDLEGVYASDTVEGFYDRIANILAQNVVRRRKQGLYRDYVCQSEKSETIRGRINFTKTVQKPWDPKAQIEYNEMTANNENNQILLYTLSKISASANLCREDTLQIARRGIRSMRGTIDYKTFRPDDCVGRQYNRLNRDYRRMHALSRLVLDNSGASYEVGKSMTVPFTVKMDLLYQKFVTKWLDENLPDKYEINRGGEEEKVILTEFADKELNYRIDIVLYDSERKKPIAVIDVKYKDNGRPSTRDLSQMVGYAQATGSVESFLLYPSRLEDSLDVQIGDVRVRNQIFSLNGDLESNGFSFLADLAKALDDPGLVPS